MDLFKDYYCVLHHETSGFNPLEYLLIYKRDSKTPVTSFRIEKGKYVYNPPDPWIQFYHNAGWDTYAPLIIEFVINEMHINNIYLEFFDGK